MPRIPPRNSPEQPQQDYEFYIGESMNPDAMVALLNYREDGVTPYFTFFKDGLKEEKI